MSIADSNGGGQILENGSWTGGLGLIYKKVCHRDNCTKQNDIANGFLTSEKQSHQVFNDRKYFQKIDLNSILSLT